jgi:hypothetical protein
VFVGLGVGLNSNVFVGPGVNVLVGLVASVWVMGEFMSISEGLPYRLHRRQPQGDVPCNDWLCR